jgi:hypothetical protein
VAVKLKTLFNIMGTVGPVVEDQEDAESEGARLEPKNIVNDVTIQGISFRDAADIVSGLYTT